MPKIFFWGEAEDYFLNLPMDTAWFIASQSEKNRNGKWKKQI